MIVDLRRVSLGVLAGFTMLAAPPFAVTSETTPDDLVAVASRKASPAFSLRDAAGKSHRLADFKGRVVLLDFWATWCTGCKLEIPWFVEFDKRHQREGLSAIGIAVDEEGWKTVKPYLADHPIPYPILLGDFDVP